MSNPPVQIDDEVVVDMVALPHDDLCQKTLGGYLEGAAEPNPEGEIKVQVGKHPCLVTAWHLPELARPAEGETWKVTVEGPVDFVDDNGFDLVVDGERFRFSHDSNITREKTKDAEPEWAHGDHVKIGEGHWVHTLGTWSGISSGLTLRNKDIQEKIAEGRVTVLVKQGKPVVNA